MIIILNILFKIGTKLSSIVGLQGMATTYDIKVKTILYDIKGF